MSSEKANCCIHSRPVDSAQYRRSRRMILLSMAAKFSSMIEKSFDFGLAEVETISISDGPYTLNLWIVRTYVWLSQIWQRTDSLVSRLIKARPTVGDIPRDSMTAHITCWASTLAIVEAPVLGRAVPGLPVLLRPVLGREVVVVLYSPYE